MKTYSGSLLHSVLKITFGVIFAFTVALPHAAAAAVLPTVTTTTPGIYTVDSAVLGGKVRSDGGAAVTDRGIVWALTANPTTLNTKVANGTGTGAFSATVTGFTALTLIHVRAYAINTVGTSYGADLTFTTTQDLVPTANVGQYNSQVIVSGNPAVAFYDAGSKNIHYIRATAADGSAWGTNYQVDTAGTVGQYVSMAIISGRPAMAYNRQTSTSSGLDYLRAADATGDTGTSWTVGQTFVIVDHNSGSAGQYNSLTTVNGNPAISYYDGTSGAKELKYVRASDTTGATWGSPVVVDNSSADVGQYTSLVVANGNPAISYYDVTNGDLKYVRATDVNGTAWGTPVVVDSTGNVGQYTSMVIANGNPAIAYYDVTNGDLKYVRATNPSGTAWGVPVTLDSTGNVGQGISMAIITGYPAISYYDVTNANLKYVQATDASGTAWGTLATWDSTGDKGRSPSLAAIASGAPAVAYENFTSGTVSSVDWTMGFLPPTVTSIVPNSGTTAGGTSVTITGTNFIGVTSVTIGGVAATSVVEVSETQITAVTPAGSVGTASVVVTARGGANTANTLYTYFAPAIVITATQTSVTSTSAVLGGNVTSDGGNAVTDRGIVWALTSNPTTSDTKVPSASPTGTGVFSDTVSGFSPGTLIHVRAYAINSTATSYGSDISFITLALATVTTAPQTSVTSTSAVLGGEVVLDGGAAVTDRGIVWDTSPNPTTSNNKVPSASPTGTGVFSDTVAGFTSGTTVYVRAYAINSVGTSYGNSISVFIIGAPDVTTAAPIALTSTSSTLGGTVNSDNGSAVTDRGIVWGTSPDPTTSDTKVPSASPTGTGSFSDTVSGLPPATLIYVRAYAINSVGTSYGSNVVSFIPGAPTVTTATQSGVTATTAVLGGNVTSDGGAAVTDRGIVWALTASPTTSNTKVPSASPTGTGIFSDTVSGLPANTLIYVRAYAINSAGTNYGDDIHFTTGGSLPTVTTATQTSVTGTSAVLGGNVTSDGGTAVTDRGIVWGLSANPTTSDTKVPSAIPTGTGIFSDTVSGFTPGTTVHVRAYAINSVGTSYGSDISFTLLSTPTVTTAAQTSVTDTSAVLGGNVTSDGGNAVTDRGIVWGLSINPTTSDTKVPSASPTGTGIFSDTVSGFSSGTTIHVRAYAINSVGTSYGGDISFTLLNTATVITATQTSVTSTSAVLGGNVTSDGGAAVTDRGIVWALTANPTTSDTKVPSASPTGTGIFSDTVTGFSPGTLVHVRAYAINSVGTSYGSDISFYTLPTVTPPADGTYNESDVLTFIVNYGVAVTVNTTGGTPYISVNIGGILRNAVYFSGSGTANLVFKYTVQSVDLDLDGIVVVSPIVLNGGTMKDGSGNDVSLAFTPPVTTGVLVDGRVVSTGGAASDAAPGTVVGGASVGTWDSIRSGMVIASSGALAFRAHLDMVGGVTALNYQGIWKSPDGTFASTYLLARTGSDAPGTGAPSAVFDLLPLNPYIDNLGQNTFVGFLRVGTGTPAVTSSNDSGIWSEQASGGTGPRLLLRDGDAVTGGTVTMVAPSGWAGVSLPATTSADAYTAFNVQLDGNTATPGSALLRVKSTSALPPAVATLAKQGDAAPGGGTFDVMYGNSNDPRMDGNGNVAFLAYMVDGSSDIFYDDVATSTLSAVARSGALIPGGGDTFTGFERPSLASNGGQIAFRAFLATTGQSVWKGDPTVPGGLVAIAKTGDTALTGIPGGSQLWSVWSPFSNASGKVAFRVSLMDSAIPPAETRAIVTDTNGTLGVVAKVGDVANGTDGLPLPSGETFTNFDHPIIGDGNQVAFSAATSGGMVGIWKQAAGGGALSLRLKVGDAITSNGVTRTVGAFIVVGTASSDRLNEVVSMNAAGQILVWVLYDTGDTGILLTVP